jgi:hypothetical protein
MKKLIRNISIVAAVVIAFVVTGCEVCVTCTDPSSNDVQDFCGKKPSADTFERTWENLGYYCTTD